MRFRSLLCPAPSSHAHGTTSRYTDAGVLVYKLPGSISGVIETGPSTRRARRD